MNKIKRATKLTPNQSAALAMLAEGFTVKEIAGVWDVSGTVVYKTIEGARKKLGARTTLQAVVLWVEMGSELAAKMVSSRNGANGVHA